MEKLSNCRINVMVTDMDRAIEFYVGLLGLELLNRYGNHYAEVQAANLVLGLHPKTENVVFGNSLSIGFGVSDFDGNVARLQAKGLEISVQQDGRVRLAHFADPDRNALYLEEVK